MKLSRSAQRRCARSAQPQRRGNRARAVAHPVAAGVEFEAVNHQEETFRPDLERLSLDADTARDLYRDMKLGRDFEDMCAQMYYRGKMFGFVHLYCGQEAVSTGVIRLLGKRDYVCRRDTLLSCPCRAAGQRPVLSRLLAASP